MATVYEVEIVSHDNAYTKEELQNRLEIALNHIENNRHSIRATVKEIKRFP